MRNTKTRLRTSALSAAALLGISLLGPFGGTVAKGADAQKAVMPKNPDHLVRRESRCPAFTQP